LPHDCRHGVAHVCASAAADVCLYCTCLLLLLQGKLCWVLQCLAVLLGLNGTAQRLANAPTLQVGNTYLWLAVAQA
jgi:hypothetical protein